MFGPLVRSIDPGRFYALDPEAAACIAYNREPFVLAVGIVGSRDQGRTGRRHGLLMHGITVSVLRSCVLSRKHLPYVGVAGPGLGIDCPDPDADALLDRLLSPVDVAPF